MDLTDTVFAPVPYEPRSWASPYDALQVRDYCIRQSIDSYMRYQEQLKSLRNIIGELRGENGQ